MATAIIRRTRELDGSLGDVAGTVQPNNKNMLSGVWCVRGGMNADAY